MCVYAESENIESIDGRCFQFCVKHDFSLNVLFSQPWRFCFHLMRKNVTMAVSQQNRHVKARVHLRVFGVL